MIFGLPGAALAMYRCAKPEKKKAAGGLQIIPTGITNNQLVFSFPCKIPKRKKSNNPPEKVKPTAILTRLRCTVKDASLINDSVLKATGASGVVHKGNGVQVIYGPNVTVI